MLIFLDGTSCSGKTTTIKQLTKIFKLEAVYLDFVDIKFNKNENYLNKWYEIMLEKCSDFEKNYIIDRFAPLSNPVYNLIFDKTVSSTNTLHINSLADIEKNITKINFSYLINEIKIKNQKFINFLERHKSVILFITNTASAEDFTKMTKERGYFDANIENLPLYKNVQNLCFNNIESTWNIEEIKLKKKFFIGPVRNYTEIINYIENILKYQILL